MTTNQQQRYTELQYLQALGREFPIFDLSNEEDRKNLCEYLLDEYANYNFEYGDEDTWFNVYHLVEYLVKVPPQDEMTWEQFYGNQFVEEETIETLESCFQVDQVDIQLEVMSLLNVSTEKQVLQQFGHLDWQLILNEIYSWNVEDHVEEKPVEEVVENQLYAPQVVETLLEIHSTAAENCPNASVKHFAMDSTYWLLRCEFPDQGFAREITYYVPTNSYRFTQLSM